MWKHNKNLDWHNDDVSEIWVLFYMDVSSSCFSFFHGKNKEVLWKVM